MELSIFKRDRARKRRRFRIRKRIYGTSEKPRMNVYKSHSHIYVQLIDDDKQHTLIALGTMAKEMKEKKLGRKSKKAAKHLGQTVAQLAKKKNISKVIFDRGINKYHGIIAELATAAREAGLQF